MTAKQDLGWAWKPNDSEKPKPGLSPKVSKAERRRIKRQERKAKQKWKIRIKKKLGWRERCCALPATKFYRTNAWWNLRGEVLKVYGYKCMLCGSIEDIQVDHIQPRSLAPHLSLTFSNLQVLCRDCNGQKSNIHAEDYREYRVTELLDDQLLSEMSWL